MRARMNTVSFSTVATHPDRMISGAERVRGHPAR